MGTDNCESCHRLHSLTRDKNALKHVRLGRRLDGYVSYKLMRNQYLRNV